MSTTHRRPWRTLIERDIAEVERRLRLYRANTPKRIADEMRLHANTVSTINLGRHPIQARLATEGGQLQPSRPQEGQAQGVPRKCAPSDGEHHPAVS
jgi:hypothetical protein